MAGAQPKITDYADTAEGLEQYVEANEQWKADHPDDAAKAADAQRAADAALQPGAQPVEEEAAKPEAEVKPEQPAAQPAAPGAATPQALDDLLTRNVALKAALDASPTDKEVLMATARAAEAAKPVLRLVPTEAEARFAVENTNKFLGLQHKFAMAAELPEMADAAWNEFESLFHVVNDKGEVIKEADGTPRLTPSFSLLTNRVTQGALGGHVAELKTTLAELKAKVETGVYPNEAAKAADRGKLEDAEYALAAFNYVTKMLETDGSDDLKLPELPADATPAQRELQERLARQVEDANAQNKKSTREARIAERRKFEGEMNQEFGRGVGSYLRTEIDARKARGEYIPDILLNRKWINPATNENTDTSDFAMRMHNEFVQKVRSIPTVTDELMRLQALGPAGKQARLDRWAQLRQQYLPNIVDTYLNSVQDEIRQMQQSSSQRQSEVAQVARVEPQTQQQPAAPQPLTGEGLDTRAMELLKTDPEYLSAPPSEQLELLINKREELRAGKVR